jgi:murein tripeptide amidase MpaA
VACEYLTIGESRNEHKKPGVVLTARAHPGETVSSFMMQGALEFLAGQEPEAIALREHFTFIVVPMLNPDGVIVGNNRSGLDGSDLNRRFRNPSKVPRDWHRIDLAADRVSVEADAGRESEGVHFCVVLRPSWTQQKQGRVHVWQQ